MLEHSRSYQKLVEVALPLKAIDKGSALDIPFPHFSRDQIAE